VSPIDRLQKNIRLSVAAKLALAEPGNPNALAFARACDAALLTYKKGGCLFIAGNGGSAADAQHLAAEFVSRLAQDRAPLPAEALTVDSSVLTAIGNDYGFEEVFSRQLRAKAKSEDLFLAISTSGKSPNIVRALKTCRALGVRSILFAGRDGGNCLPLADFAVIAPGDETATIQECHILLCHTLCEHVEAGMFGF
jgi:D-sedoheptulose 7-phosphate isomerase